MRPTGRDRRKQQEHSNNKREEEGGCGGERPVAKRYAFSHEERGEKEAKNPMSTPVVRCRGGEEDRRRDN